MKLFNPNGSDSPANREIWGGDTTNLIQLNNVKHMWALKLYNQMRENLWIAMKVDLSTDINSIKSLNEKELEAFKGTIGYLVFLDSIQVSNLPHLMNPITAPEVRICLSEQLSQEVEHARSYQYIIETLFPAEEREEIYDYWRKDKVLRDRCADITEYFQDYVDSYDNEWDNYFISLVADYMLEGLFFYNGFNFFYSLASRGLMTFTKNIIQLINRDEKSHVFLFQNLVKDYMNKVSPYDIKIAMQVVEKSVEAEIAWSQHILGDSILGISSHSIDQYTKYRANNLLVNIGLEPIYQDVSNPYAHLEKMADIGSEANVKANFFDSTITSYVQAETLNDWDF